MKNVDRFMMVQQAMQRQKMTRIYVACVENMQQFCRLV